MSSAPPALHRLLHEVIDYAGLFPPAGLSMPEAVVNYAAYRTGGHAWMLARFIAPAARLDEFAEAVAGLRSSPRVPWRISAVVADAPDDAAARIAEFNARDAATMRVDAVEVRAAAPEAVEPLVARFRERLEVFVEIPLDGDVPAMLAAVRAAGAMAKARTGGITPDAFPLTEELARFIAACMAEGIAFKATAGLHHALRSEYRLTYDPDAPRGLMYGFLNVLVAAALARAGADAGDLVAALDERDPAAFRFDGDIRWRDHRLGDEEVRQARTLCRAFGSCSFTEPVEDLVALELL